MKRVLFLFSFLLIFASIAFATTYGSYADRVKLPNGTPAYGARVYVYVAGTLTPTTLYADLNATATVAQPLITDASGNFYFYAANGTYDLKIVRTGYQDAWARNIIVEGAIFATTTEVSTKLTTSTIFVTPEMFGGGISKSAATNDAALLSAVAFIKSYSTIGTTPNAWAFGGGEIHLGSGSYSFSSPITLYQNMRLVGNGRNVTALLYTGSTNTAIILDYYAVTGSNHNKANIAISDLTLDAGGKTNVGIWSKNDAGLQDSFIVNTNVYNAQVGVWIDTGWDNLFADNHLADCIVGMIGYTTTSARGFNQNVIEHNTFDRFTRHGLLISGIGTRVNNNTFQFDMFTGADSAPATMPTHTFPVALEIYGQDATTLGINPGNYGTDTTTVKDNYFENVSDSSMGVGIYMDNVDATSGVSLLRDTMISGNRFHNDVNRPIFINNASKTKIIANHYKGTNANLITLATPSVISTIIDEQYYHLLDYSGGKYAVASYVDADYHSLSKLLVGSTTGNMSGIFRIDGGYTAVGTSDYGASFGLDMSVGFGGVRAYNFRPNFIPTADLSGSVLYGLVSDPTLTTSSYSLNTFNGGYFHYNIVSGYTGTVSIGNTIKVDSPSISGSVPAKIAGIVIENQGHAGATESYAIDVKDQSGSTASHAIRSPGLTQIGKSGNTCYTLYQSWVASELTGTTATVTLATVTIPAGSIGANGSLYFDLLTSNTVTAANKVLTVKLGSTTFLTHTTTTAANKNYSGIIGNRGSESSQIISVKAMLSSAAVVLTSTTAPVDTSAETTLTVRGAIADITETFRVDGLKVGICYQQ